MADGVIDSLSIEIETTSSKAVSNITKLASALAKLKTASNDLGANGGAKLQSIANTIGEIGNAMDRISDSSIARIERLASALKDLKGVNLKGVSSALKAVKTDADFKTSGSKWADTVTGMVEEANPDDVGKIDLSGLSSDLQQIGKTFASSVVPGAKEFAKLLRNAVITAGKLAVSIAKTATSLAGAGFKKLKNLFGGDGKSGVLGNFAKSFGRIAFYRIIRSMIKALTDAFKEGLENAYAFSQGIATEGHRFAAALDSMSTAGLMMKNQLGSAFIALLAAIEPVVNAIIALVTRLADVISQFLAAFTGGTYLRAVNFPKQWADGAKGAGKAAKEWKNQLLGFDEINRLEAPSSGNGGSGTSLDPSGMFNDSPISESIKNFVELLKSTIKNGNWQGAGFLIGRKLSDIIGSIDAAGLGRKLVKVIGNAFDFALGFLRGLDFRTIGEKIGDFLTSAFNSASEWLSGKDWGQIGGEMFDKFKGLIEGIDFASLAESFFRFLGSAFGAAVAFIDGFFKDTIQSIKDYFSEKTEEAGGDAWEGFKKGISEAAKNVYDWVKEHVVDPFVNAFKDLLGIHSPSTVFEGFGENIIEGLWEGINKKWADFTRSFEELWYGLKRWWESLKLGAFHIPHPIFSWTYSEATGAIARALEFVGLPATIPHLNITWAAKGGILDGATLIGAGEAGKEALIPLERNREWIGSVARELQSMGGFGGADTAEAVEESGENIVSAIMSATMQIISAMNGNNSNGNMDIETLVQEITRIQRRQARSTGAA